MTEIERSKNLKANKVNMVKQARFSENYKYIIDKDGQKIEFDDPRLVYVDPEPRNPYGRRLVINLFKKYNRKIRISKETDASVLQYAKKICSGRECLASVAIAGADKDTFNRYPEEGIPTYNIKRNKYHASSVDIPIIK